MLLDNSQQKAFNLCPWYWKENYFHKIQKKNRTSDALAFGTRVHHLFECRDNKREPDVCNELFEAEAQTMFAKYNAKYPVEDWDIITAEQYFEIPLPRANCPHCGREYTDKDVVNNRQLCYACDATATIHIYNGKFDGIVRQHENGMLALVERKTEKRGSKANQPAAWAVRPQASLYMWAAEQIYKEPIDCVYLDVLTRQSPAGREECSFPPRQKLQRTTQQKEEAVRDIIYVADKIEELIAQFGTAPEASWPSDKEQCAPMNWKCQFHDLHIFGRTDALLENDYEQAEEYLKM